VAEAGLAFVDEFTRILTARASQLPSGLPHSWCDSPGPLTTETTLEEPTPYRFRNNAQLANWGSIC
jgi:hypothetical protein